MGMKKFCSILLAAILAVTAFGIGATQAQIDPPSPAIAPGDAVTLASAGAAGSPPQPGDLAMIEEYIQNTFQGPGEQLMAPAAHPYSLSPVLLAKAEPDECYNGIGQPYSGTPPLCEDVSGARPKVNQAYVWGLVKSNEDLWFGTAPNVHCLVLGGANLIPYSLETPSYVCEFGESQYSPPAADPIGDWRPPQAYVYDTVADTLTNVSPLTTTTTITDTQRFTSTLGLRSAGLINDTVFLAGPALDGSGVNMFAYDAPSGSFLGSTTLITYTNIRKWVEVDGILYTGVRKNTGSGAVLRYTGDPSDADRLFEFEEVGLPAASSDAAEITLHDGRLFVSTWPATGKRASLWMSPPIPPGGLTSADINLWTKVWDIIQYEPDPLTAALTGGGALASYDGYLYWGSMHVPFVSFQAHMNMYPPNPAWDDETYYTYLITTLFGSHRAISIFRGRDFGTPNQTIELLYGEETLPVFTNQTWQIVPNNMSATPSYGGSGFDNFFNNYTWSMEVYDGELFVGTMDWSYLAQEGLTTILGALGVPLTAQELLPDSIPGADLYRFISSSSPAQPVDLSGLGNYASYGVRNMVSDDSLYVGMANPMNLLTNTSDSLPEGGWELLQMVDVPPDPDLQISKTTDSSPITPGEPFTYTLAVSNYSLGPATNVILEDTLPPEATYESASPGCSQDSGLVSCNLGTMPGFSKTWVQIRATAPLQSGYLFNQAVVYSDEPDQNFDDNTTYLWTLVEYPTDLAITKTASQDSAVVGQNVTYTIGVTNLGPGAVVSSSPFTATVADYINIPSYGSAYPYPSSTLSFNGLEGKVGKVTVSLHGLMHARLADLDIMLVAPNGRKVMLMSDVGSGFNYNSNLELTFDDDAWSYLPSSGAVTSGSYHPTDYFDLLPDIFPAPVPFGPVFDNLSAFEGLDPNGAWELYVVDDLLGYSGHIAGGWTLNLTLLREVTVSDQLPDEVAFSSVSGPGWDCQHDEGEVTCSAQDLPVSTPYTITLVTTVLPAGQNVFTNTATISSETYDPDWGNDSAEAVVAAFKCFLPIIFR